MKRFLIVLFCMIVISACKTDKKGIEYKKIDNLDLGNLSKDNATLKATAVFMNLSDEEYNFKDLVLDLTVNGKDVGTIVTKISKKIAPVSEFSIPIQYSYETSSIIEKGNDPSATYAVQLSGDLTLKDKNGKEITTTVKFTTTSTYQTKKEIRIEKREDRKKRREERKAAKDN